MNGLWVLTPYGDVVLAHGIRTLVFDGRRILVLDRVDGTTYPLYDEEIATTDESELSKVMSYRLDFAVNRLERTLKSGGLVDLSDLLSYPKGDRY